MAKGNDLTLEVRKIVVKPGITGNFFVDGNNVNFVNNNSTITGGDNSVIVWSEGSTPLSKWVKRTGVTYRTTEDLSNSGIQAQVSNGSDLSSINAMVFSTVSQPYFFTQASTDFSIFHGGGGGLKITTGNNGLTFGRTGIVGKNGVQFVFNIGDVILADTNVQFIPRADTIIYYSADELNQVTRSLTFHLDNQSQFYFTDYYYTVNPEIADSVLTDSDEVSFKVELVNSNTDEVAGTFDQMTYTKNNLNEYDNINYQVNCSNIQEGDYYLRLVTSVEGESSYNLANVQNDNPGIEKRQYREISFKGNEVPKTYDLSQNFPNPFNPTTKIAYQVPKPGNVELKVYDILGREVATLVNEYKNIGKYTVDFNASKLASGIYIYRLKSGNFISTKKMVLLK